MKRLVMATAVLALSMAVDAKPPVDYSWDDNLTYHEAIRVTGFSVWKDQSPVFIKFDNGSGCYIDHGENNLYSLVLTLLSTKNQVNVLCVKNQATSYGGMTSERLSQIWFDG